MGFLALTAALVALGAEEVMAFHESASVELANAADLAGADSGGTPYLGYALLPVLAWGTWRLAGRCCPRARRGLVVGVAVWFVATFVTEHVDAWNLAVGAAQLDDALRVHRIITALQEGGEMLGVAIVLVALLEQLQHLGGARIDVGRTRP